MSADLTSYFDETELGLVVEGLTRLLAIKQEAFRVVTEPGIPGSERFRPADFGIPQIDSLLTRFGERPELGALASAAAAATASRPRLEPYIPSEPFTMPNLERCLLQLEKELEIQ